MNAVFTLARYPLLLSIAGFSSMAIFRIPIGQNKKINFFKLMGCGKGGSFSKIPGINRWAIFVVTDQISPDLFKEKNTFKLHSALYGKFIASWFTFFRCKTCTLILQPVSGHGKWDGKVIFKNDLPKTSTTEEIAVLTRATLNIDKVNRFFGHVGQVSKDMAVAPGYICSVGIGEVPWLKQGTFSIWQNMQSMTDFAFHTPNHQDVIKKTREEKWYKEEMFVRFNILNKVGEWV